MLAQLSLSSNVYQRFTKLELTASLNVTVSTIFSIGHQLLPSTSKQAASPQPAHLLQNNHINKTGDDEYMA